MADILYTYKDQVYANITNKCNCRCRFCIRSHEDGVGDADTLWHKTDPTLEQIKEAMDAFDFAGYKELVFCGYGEPLARSITWSLRQNMQKRNMDCPSG